MPRPKTKAKPKTKTMAKKRNYKKSGATTVNKSLAVLGAGFPKKMLVTHRYFDNESINATSGAFSKLVISCNGMYDPNITSAGHQPMYFDQLAALYNHYTVIGSKINIKVVPGSTSQPAFCIGVFLNDDHLTTPTNFINMNENTLSKYVIVPAGANNTYTLKQNWSAKKFFGGSVLASDDLKGSAASNPAEQTHYTIYMQSCDQLSTSAAFVEITVEYIAIWKELKELAGS